jgi:hypothetical protein
LASHCQWPNLSDIKSIRFKNDQLPNPSDSEPVRYHLTYQIPNLTDTNLSVTKPIRFRTYQILDLSETDLNRYEPISYQTKPMIQNIPDTWTIRHRPWQIQTYQLPNLSDSEHTRYLTYQIANWTDMNLSVNKPIFL